MAESGKKMAGLTLKSLKRHKSLVPLLGAIGLGALAAGSYVLRLATTNPDVSWDKRKNPEPWQKLGTTGQYKFYAARHDYKALEKPTERPDF